MVLDKLRKGLRSESPVIAALKGHQWTSEAQKKDMIAKFQALPNLELEEIVWTATDPTPELRSAGLDLLKRRPDKGQALDALIPHLRTRSEAARRAVQRFLQELASADLGPFLVKLATTGDDFSRLAALELARSLPAEAAHGIYKQVLQDPNPKLRARALKAVSDTSVPGSAGRITELALPLLKDVDEEIRLAALSVLERNPSEALIPPVLELTRSGGGRVAEAALATLRRLLPTAKTDFTHEIMPLLADGSSTVRAGAVSLLEKLPPEVLARRFLLAFRDSFVWIRDRALETTTKAVPNFLPSLLRLTMDPDADVAHSAAEMTLSVSDPRAVPVWLNLTKDPDWWVRHRALEVLGKNGKGRDDALAKLLEALKDPEVMLSAAAALGEFGDRRAAGPVYEAFKAAADRPGDQLELLDSMASLGAVEPRMGPVIATIANLETLSVKIRDKARRIVGKLQGDGARDAIPLATVAPVAIDLSTIKNPKLLDLLADTVAHKASDFHIAVGFVPHRRLDGTLEPLDLPQVTPETATSWIKEIVTEAEWRELEQHRQIDLCVKVPGLGRFRANVFSQKQGYDATFRVIPQELMSLSEIGLPESVWDVTRYTQGLVLVTGPAGCGKSTTLACLLDRVNETRKGHIITVEDPVEFLHPNKECLVNQRQVPQHTVSFARALKAALREDPDVILIGEMRDLETISLAISASETGHLVLGTLHTTTAPGTIDRLINAFPPGQQGQIRAMVSDSLKAVISQALLPRPGGKGRVAAFEIMRGTPAVSALIRESKTFQLGSTLQTGQLSGMNTMDQALMKLVEAGKVDLEAALDRAAKKEPFEKLLQEERQALA